MSSIEQNVRKVPYSQFEHAMKTNNTTECYLEISQHLSTLLSRHTLLCIILYYIVLYCTVHCVLRTVYYAVLHWATSLFDLTFAEPIR